MKLAEALMIKSDLMKQSEQIKKRLMNNLIVQEGEKPSEDPEQLMIKFYETNQQLANITMKINNTNSTVMFDETRTIADVLVERDFLLKMRNLYASIVEGSTDTHFRYSSSEIKYLSSVDVQKAQSYVDSYSKSYRVLDIKLQAKNWEVDLI